MRPPSTAYSTLALVDKQLRQRFAPLTTTTASSAFGFTSGRSVFTPPIRCPGIHQLKKCHHTVNYFSISSQLLAASNRMAEAEPVGQGTSTAGSGTNGDRSKCVFCKIADGKEDNEIFYQDEEIVVFQDIKPASKHHLLIIPREHIRDSKSLIPSQLGLLERLIEIGDKVLLQQIQKESPEVSDLAQVQKLSGFHWPPFHTVSHLHLHVIAPSDKMGFIARTIFRPNSYWFVPPEYVKERLEKMASDTKPNPSGNN